MNLKPRFMLLTALLFFVAAIAISWSVRTLAEDIIENWAPRFIIKQALYDKSRTLQPILRELALSRQLISSNFLKQWAADPDNKNLTDSSLKELESYRLNFHDKNYFVAFLNNGHYYHNNRENEYQGKEFRYILHPDKPKDQWFYNLIKQKRDIHINVNPDEALGVTKLWIDVLIRDGENILGVAGTGLDLTDFLTNVVIEKDPGTINLFVDHTGAIQLHRNQSLIDFDSIGKTHDQHKTIDLIFKNQDDKQKIHTAMKQLENGSKQVITDFVEIQGKQHLLGITYLPEIDWYEITLIDMSYLLPLSNFSKIIFVFVATLLVALVVLNFALNRLVLNPISRLDHAMRLFEQGKSPTKELNQTAKSELGRVTKHFIQMSETVLESKKDLERKVHDRTLKLERLTRIDPLTELLNRRGMTTQMEDALNKSVSEKNVIGLIWLDIDWFKELNDTHGHATGDDALKAVAKIIKETIRFDDLASRWGGDEFLVLLTPADTNSLFLLAERLRSKIAENQLEMDLSISVSIGCALSSDGMQLDTLLHNADKALYRAKENGRNCCYIHQ